MLHGILNLFYSHSLNYMYLSIAKFSNRLGVNECWTSGCLLIWITLHITNLIKILFTFFSGPTPKEIRVGPWPISWPMPDGQHQFSWHNLEQFRERIDTRPVIPDGGSTRILSATEVKNYWMEKNVPKIRQICRASSSQKRIGDWNVAKWR